ncbi:MAG: hypothetical protein H6658_09905 [Ardenticatenaceae bacterium]|nr:hypothetical protein [Ardenticatenaceae bacterium]
MTSIPNWEAISKKLQQESKAGLIQLIQELTAVSPEAQRYLQTRYLKGTTADQIAPYRQVIQEQFVTSDWNNTLSWNFAGVQKAIDDYAQSSRGDEVGMAELLVAALETAVKFANNFNLQDDDFDNSITELADRCTNHFQDYEHLLPTYKRRIEKIQKIGSDLGYYALDESLDDLTSPYR